MYVATHRADTVEHAALTPMPVRVLLRRRGRPRAVAEVSPLRYVVARLGDEPAHPSDCSKGLCARDGTSRGRESTSSVTRGVCAVCLVGRRARDDGGTGCAAKHRANTRDPQGPPAPLPPGGSAVQVVGVYRVGADVVIVVATASCMPKPRGSLRPATPPEKQRRGEGRSAPRQEAGESQQRIDGLDKQRDARSDKTDAGEGKRERQAGPRIPPLLVVVGHQPNRTQDAPPSRPTARALPPRVRTASPSLLWLRIVPCLGLP